MNTFRKKREKSEVVDEKTNTKIIKIKSNNKKTTPIIVDDETSEFLKSLKIDEQKEEKENKETVEVEEDIYPRYKDVDITQGLSEAQVNERISQGLTNKNKDNQGKSIIEIILSNVFTGFNILYFIIAGVLIFIDIKNHDISYHIDGAQLQNLWLKINSSILKLKFMIFLFTVISSFRSAFKLHFKSA